MEYKIGKVSEVRSDQLGVALNEFDATSNSGVPANMQVDVPSESGPEKLTIGQPGSFVKLSISNGFLLCLVIEIRMREDKYTNPDLKQAENQGFYLLDRVSRELTVIPVGTIDNNGNFERGATQLPTVSADVYAVLSSTIDSIYTNFAEGTFSLGKLSLLENQDAKINLDAFLSRHSAILGQTGGGKSWSVASILQKISQFKQSTVLLFDLHGEYATAFGDEAEIISTNDIELPYWLMNAEELLDLMIDRAESTAPNQNAKFKELLQHEKESHPENNTLGIKKTTVDTPVYFSLENIIKEFRRLDTEQVPGSNNKLKNGPLHGQFTRLLMRLESRINDRRYDLIFNPKKYTSSASMNDLFRTILGEKDKDRKKLVVLDLSPVPFDVRGTVISLMLRCIFDFAYWYFRVNEEQYPIAIFADEAHIYLSDNARNDATRHSAERIAKEGRKYGVSLNVISQRPREVSSTIMSQCGSFLCLRISNPDDQSYVRNLLPDSVRGITAVFASLRRGESILIGESIMMPTRIILDKPDPKPNSNDASFVQRWSEEPTEIDFDVILRSWRNQEVEVVSQI